ncbi:MAG: DUF1598 domain-containing protein [Planctomycetaceae bacterium]|jgi:hypothetical protein|nr:DUF1598 domain-containing protein [Planctomycetaceae bacterium]
MKITNLITVGLFNFFTKGFCKLLFADAFLSSAVCRSIGRHILLKRRLSIIGLLIIFSTFMLTSLYAQDSSNSNVAQGLGSGNSGVWINASNVLEVTSLDMGRVELQQLNAARKSYLQSSSSVKTKSATRFISLKHLEREIIKSNGVPTDEMKYLAGLTRIKYLFFFPDSKDIVIAGPAEGWYPGAEGMMVGQNTGKPICELQDLVVALRAFAPNKEAVDVIGCSIDPTSDGNANLQKYIRGNHLDRSRVNLFAEGMRRSLGLQTIRVDGIPETTHAARVMIAADYRMKLIGIGLEKIPVGVNITTFIEKTDLSASQSNKLHRWYFMPEYKSVVATEDKTGLELVGDGVKLVTEEEVVNSITGKREITNNSIDRASLEFTRSFTAQYPKIAKKILAYAQLRNLIDMFVCAAHIQKQDFYGKAEWSMEFFGDENKFAVQTYQSPKFVMPAVNFKIRNGKIGFPIGGVEIEPAAALSNENIKFEKQNQISNIRNKIKIELKPGQWWWD